MHLKRSRGKNTLTYTTISSPYPADHVLRTVAWYFALYSLLPNRPRRWSRPTTTVYVRVQLFQISGSQGSMQ